MKIEEHSTKTITFSEAVQISDRKLQVKVEKLVTSKGYTHIVLTINKQSVFRFEYGNHSQEVARSVSELLSKIAEHPCELPK